MATVTAARVGRNVDDIRRALALAVEPDRGGDAAILTATLPYAALLPGLVRSAIALRNAKLAAKLVDGVEPRTPLHDHAPCACRAHMTEAAGTYAEAATLHAKASERWRESGDAPECAYALLSRGRWLVTHQGPRRKCCANTPWRRRRN